MSKEHKFNGKDHYDIPYEVTIEDDYIELAHDPEGSDVGYRAVCLDNAEGVRLALFLLKAAGADLVGAARKVVESKSSLCVAEYKTDEAFEASEKMFARIDELAAVLTTIDGETP